MRIAFTRWRSGGLLNRPSPRKRLLPKKKTSSGFEFVSGLAAGASAMPAKWSRRVFSFRFYEGKISVPSLKWMHLAPMVGRNADFNKICRDHIKLKRAYRPPAARSGELPDQAAAAA